MTPHARPRNLFLQSLSAADYELLRPALTATTLKHEAVLFEAGDNIALGYFPTGAVISLVVRLVEGETVEAGMIGRDGVVGVSAALDGAHALNQAIVQIEGPCSTINIGQLREAAARSLTLRAQLYRHDQFMLAQAQQSAACNAKHVVEARLCRWLLRTRDLIDGDVIHLTQQFIAEMLGVRRTHVTFIAKNLHNAGLINYRRGRIQITDLEAVGDAACECYETINRHRRRLLGEPNTPAK
jgi:CRP-like cAMP-binding protein